MDIRELVQKYDAGIRQLRQEFHAHPELSFAEVETTRRIGAELAKMGIPYAINPLRQTGLVGRIQGTRPGAAIALRADIDALPVQEATGLSCASQNPGVMHACGHDGHIALLLGAARMLLACREEICGTVYLVFQPAEETGQGAPYMMRFGNWFQKVGMVFGGHLWGDLPAGYVSVEAGPRMAAGDQFRVLVHGRGGHGAQPRQAIDAVVAASAIVMNLQTVVARHFSPLDSVLLTIGTFQSGERFNIIAGEAELTGITRYFDERVRPELQRTMERLIVETAAAYGATAELTYTRMRPAVVNTAAASAVAAQAAAKVFGPEAVVTMPGTMASEDFAWYLEKKPGCFAFFGIHNEAKGITAAHHSDHFTIDEAVLAGGAGVYAQFALDWLAAQAVL